MAHTDLSSKAANLAQLIFDKLSGAAPLETIKLQKLMYYCQAWSWAIRNRGMFSDAVQAWKHGPVVASLYYEHRQLVVLPKEWEIGDAAAVPAADAELADAVLELYGGRSGWALRDLTHKEDPWVDAWAESNNGAKRGFEISTESMRDYYAKRLKK
ncbi:Panacea domain-containing protein [Galactobacter valiniphilus]|uniref:Panacea domain-containing protein n=1 Tax=Galactobacter valiniphilus TaxID=2676122 RepID=UPI00373579C2